MEVHTEQRDGATIVRPQGDIDLSSSSILRTSLQESSQSAEGKLIIDLANVQYMDSSGVATLVECLQLCRRAGTTLLLCQLHERVLSVFQIARLDGVFEIIPTMDEALAH
ncbi:MAG: anti-anti-sigma factor [Phycisphaerae bacterium]|nr:anti-anti-sigma factor [Phycisphaerae bacterium]MDG1899924.1 STAS domain-containing protein [Phycisphaerales bacterium]|tara:strand:- start:2139 stop:2468 length:330 start_codon:yes stop_codon:yes gene_type:complete